MMNRDRYAPSPTGLQHIGGIRTALFNYLFARSSGGAFVLRLEDTDRTRYDPAFEQNLFDTFRWLGFGWDEGPDRGGPFAPYVQSQRTELYQKYAALLLEKGRAYRCFCSPERLENVRAEREAAHSGETGYDRRCRAISAEESAARAGEEAFTVRLKIPLNEDEGGRVTRFQDGLLGPIEWKNADISGDPVLLKSDGFPTYHLANVVDDHLMEITHVLRAQEWLSSTPLHVILYQSFGWEAPLFCHLPMVMGSDGKKLSKRHGSTSIDEFRRKGYLSEALVNYVALLGCSYREGKDIYTLAELENLFSLEKLNKAPAVFDYKKLEWYNGQYIRQKTNRELAEASLPWALEQGLFGGPPDGGQRERYISAMELVRERVNYLGELPEKLHYLFSTPAQAPAEEFIPKKSTLDAAIDLLIMGKDLTAPLAGTKNDEEAEARVKERAGRAGVKPGDLLMPLRVAITGARVSPPLFGSMRLLGAETSLERVETSLAVLEKSRQVRK
jgi:glutamyl-tRNA synthetase